MPLTYKPVCKTSKGEGCPSGVKQIPKLFEAGSWKWVLAQVLVLPKLLQF
jgi:hypothetical protein